MGMREIAVDAIALRNSGKSKSEIHSAVRKRALLLGQYTESGDENAFELRLVETGEVIRFSDGKGYSYSASG